VKNTSRTKKSGGRGRTGVDIKELLLRGTRERGGLNWGTISVKWSGAHVKKFERERSGKIFGKGIHRFHSKKVSKGTSSEGGRRRRRQGGNVCQKGIHRQARNQKGFGGTRRSTPGKKSFRKKKRTLIRGWRGLRGRWTEGKRFPSKGEGGGKSVKKKSVRKGGPLEEAAWFQELPIPKTDRLKGTYQGKDYLMVEEGVAPWDSPTEPTTLHCENEGGSMGWTFPK